MTRYMKLALNEAVKAGERGEVPVGAVIVDYAGNILASDGNRVIELCDPSAHAEILVMREAAERLRNYRLINSTLYVTLEPCVMCAGAMIHARISRLVFGAADPKTGGAVSLYHIGGDGRLNHNITVEGGLMEIECGELLRDFFKRKRE